MTAHKNGNSHLYRTAVARLLEYITEAFMADTFVAGGELLLGAIAELAIATDMPHP